MTGTPRRLRWWMALLAAALGGFLLDTASPGLGWWPLVFPGTALVLAAVWHQRAGFAALVGLFAGAAFWMPHISWLTLYLGPVPWLGLCTVMMAWFALFGLTAGMTTRGLHAWGSALGVRDSVVAAASAVAVSGLWVLREQVQGFWPYGGFAWGRLAHTLADSPLVGAVSWWGFAGLSGAIALTCALPIAAFWIGSGSRRLRGLSLVGSLALVIVMAVIPVVPLESAGTLRVAAVQGNAKSAIFDDRESGDVLDDHIEVTEALLDELEAAGERVDVIVWPENSAEFEVRANWNSSRRVTALAARAEAPIVVGSILQNDDGTYTNSSLVFDASGDTAARYDKRYPVPFAEYMPNRDFFHALAPELVDLVQLEYRAGELPAAIDIETASATVRAGIAICFDIIFDQQAVAMVDAGAEVILAQTNNADFGRTDESAQQLAIARLRAVETGRTLVNISTVGTSAVVSPTGESLDALAPYTADVMVTDVELVSGATPALRFGAVIAAVWGLFGTMGILAAIITPNVARIGRGAKTTSEQRE